MADKLPEHLGPYRIIGLLGEGGMGMVYHGIHVKTEQEVAVKIIAESIGSQERFRRRFAQEVETLERLTHPHIVKLIGYGEEQGRLFYSMEYVAGKSLQQIIKRDGRLDWQTTVRYSLEVTSALKHAHDIGVIHRDIKPANLLIDNDDRVKMTDFGIAKLFGSSEETALGSVLGTADYMPPEQAEGTRVTSRSDLYALGALMYVCLSGRSPHAAKTVPEVLYNVRYKIPEALSDRFADVPKELDILIQELLEKDPKKRPPTALVVFNRLSAMRIGLEKLSQKAKDFQVDEDADLRLQDFVDDASFSVASEGNETRAIDLSSKKPSSTKGYDVTMASEELLAASHMGQTTDIATHLSEFKQPPSAEAAVSSTHFTTVDNSNRTRIKTTFDTEPVHESAWQSYLSIGLLVTALLGCVVGIFWATRQPGADVFYDDVVAAIERNRPLEEVGTKIDSFASNYPDDARLEEFNDVKSELEMERRLANLNRTLQRSGEHKLSAFELAYVEAMRLRERSTSEATEQLQQLTLVFQDRSLLNSAEQSMLDYATRELERLRSTSTFNDSDSTQFLQSQLDAAAKISVAERERFYQAVIKLYADNPTAKSAVQRARFELERLSKSE